MGGSVIIVTVIRLPLVRRNRFRDRVPTTTMATPLRFRVAPGDWRDRVRSALRTELDDTIGVTSDRPWYKLDGPYEARRFDMVNGDTALFAWDASCGYWLGNTRTPSPLWRTNKVEFDAVPGPVREWATRELLAELYEDEPWLRSFPTIATFFLPVLCAKDGREGARQFFRDRAAGFPDVDRDRALGYYESLLADGTFDGHRHEMAGKLGTSNQFDETRMAAAMSEFTVAAILSDAGYAVEPEIPVSTGHSIDFKASRNGDAHLVEVTRPSRPTDRSAGTPVAAAKDTVAIKTDGQLDAHGGGVTLFVDCSSFSASEWAELLDARPDVGHRPAVVFRMRPPGDLDGYAVGRVPVAVDAIEVPA